MERIEVLDVLRDNVIYIIDNAKGSIVKYLELGEIIKMSKEDFIALLYSYNKPHPYEIIYDVYLRGILSIKNKEKKLKGAEYDGSDYKLYFEEDTAHFSEITRRTKRGSRGEELKKKLKGVSREEYDRRLTSISDQLLIRTGGIKLEKLLNQLKRRKAKFTINGKEYIYKRKDKIIENENLPIWYFTLGILCTLIPILLIMIGLFSFIWPLSLILSSVFFIIILLIIKCKLSKREVLIFALNTEALKKS